MLDMVVVHMRTRKSKCKYSHWQILLGTGSDKGNPFLPEILSHCQSLHWRMVEMSLIAFWPKPSSLVFIFVFLPAQVLDDMLPASKRTEMLDLEELIEEKVSWRMLSLDLFLIEERGNLNEETFKGNDIENSFQKKLQVEGEKVQDTAEQTSWNQGNQLILYVF